MIMKKRKYLIMLVCCLQLMTGCSMDGNMGSSSGTEARGTEIVQNGGGQSGNMDVGRSDLNAQTDTPADAFTGGSRGQEGGSKPMNSAAVEGGLNQFQGLDEIQYAGGDRILLFADKIYLYELTGQRVAAEAEYPESDGMYSNLKTWITDGGFCMAYEIWKEKQEDQTSDSESVVFGGGESKSGSSHIMYAYFDTNLRLQKIIDLTELGAAVTFIHETAPSMDGGRIVACERGKGIFLYDVDTMAKVEVLRTDGENSRRGGLISVSRAAFVDNDSRIVFLGSCFEDGEGYKCYGSVKTDGGGLAVHRENTFDVMDVYPEHVIFSEELPDNMAGGQVRAYYPSQDTSRMVQLTETKESSYAWGSDKGNYFITAVSNDKTGWTLRLYDVRTAKLVSTKVYEADIEDYREPHICYLEDLQTAVLLQRPYGNNEQFKAGIVTFQ